MKTIGLSELKDRSLGKKGTSKRDEYDPENDENQVHH